MKKIIMTESQSTMSNDKIIYVYIYIYICNEKFCVGANINIVNKIINYNTK